MSDDRRRALGRRGEQLAAEHLRRRGYAVLARNVRTRDGEIDLIARQRTTLVFVEVKTRCVGAHQSAIRADQLPLAGLGARQRTRLRRLAAAWLRDAAPRTSASTLRFDAIGVVLDTRGALRRLEHVENAW
ncbi:MAG TPA: YraN family protein [Solirubrobacteraceae bacterium]